ncbi:MAG: MBL fold metallo-hydrolase [Nostocoides sp.]
MNDVTKVPHPVTAKYERHTVQLMDPSTTSTAMSISPDSGDHWTVEGAWPVAPGVHRIPLPLPMDGLRAVNVYVIEGADGLTLIDGGWAIEIGRQVLERSLRQLDAGVQDIRQFLVTHIHRDHYTMASVLGAETGASISLGRQEQPALEAIHAGPGVERQWSDRALHAAGADALAEEWARQLDDTQVPQWWHEPDTWLESDQRIELGARDLDAIHTPGHTPGHFVFADAHASLLFAGDHVLPTITPSIGFVYPTPHDPLGNFLASLAKVRAMPDLRILPAHGPVAPSSHARVEELLTHHEHRLALALESVRAGRVTAYAVAGDLPWTRHERRLAEMDVFNAMLAIRETMAHLDVLAARGQVTRTEGADGVLTFDLPLHRA